MNTRRVSHLCFAGVILFASSAIVWAERAPSVIAQPATGKATSMATNPIVENTPSPATQSTTDKVLPPAAAPTVDPATTPAAEPERTTQQPGQSGFRLMSLSTNALMSRVSLADRAEHSLDLQYYIFKNDATGRLVALHVLKAADRGVHVRILLDDLNLADEIRMFNALDSHPNIEVRLFNPFLTRNPSVISKSAQFLLQWRRLNRRMHNKSFIVDNIIAVIGGRNIGDEYFDASGDHNFRDLDVLAIGPVVPDATRTFDAYWNSDAAHPVTEYRSKKDPGVDLDALRPELEKDARKFDQSAYAQSVLNDLPNGSSADRPGNWYWGNATLVADQPEKIQPGPDQPSLRIGPDLKTLLNGAQSEVLLISPYFVPGKGDEQEFTALAQRKVAVKVLTNSLASTDEVAVHEGYSDHRRALLKGGVQLFELKPAPGVEMAAADSGGSSGVSLHAKSFVVDRHYVFIGSMNMDQRSKLLNTEMGVVVDSPELAKAIAEFFQTATLPANAYHVVLGAADGSHASEMHWRTTTDGKDIDEDSEPDTTLRRRAKVLLMKLLPIDGLL